MKQCSRHAPRGVASHAERGRYYLVQLRNRLQSLCTTCVHVRIIVSGKGSRFLLCQLSQQDGAYLKYPPQPVIRCTGYTKVKADEPPP